MSIKLDLQMFAEGDPNGTSDTGAEEQSLGGYEQFEELYNNGLQDEDVDTDETTDTGADDTDADADSNTDIDTQAQQQPWKNQYNAQQAAQRRRQEEAQRVQRERDAVYAQIYAGQINPYTNKPIQSEQDYQEYVRQYTQEQLQQAGIDQNVVQQAVNADPRVQQAAAIIQQQQVFQAQQAQMQQKQQFQTALQNIQQFDSSVKGFEDIINNSHFAEIEQKLSRNGKKAIAWRMPIIWLTKTSWHRKNRLRSNSR